MRDLLSHLVQAEDAIPHFYCDHVGLVTIATGLLVDRDGAPDSTGKQLAADLSRRAGVRFSMPSGGAVSTTDVENDWQRVKSHGRANRGLGARAFANVAQLRIDDASIRSLTETTVRKFADQLYANRPVLLEYDARVAMAMVDVRYNPAGIKLYGDTPEIQAMWTALDPFASSFDLDKAVQAFESIWAGRGVARYGLRHYRRVQWLRAGLLAMGGATAPQSV